SFNINNFANSFKYYKYINIILKNKFGAIYIDFPNFYNIFFNWITGFKIILEAVFNKYIKGSELFFYNS
ncbi:hypothetical protein NEUTE1DRAFT_50563, partial [Neurospora tetrasperma FGSC 2508]